MKKIVLFCFIFGLLNPTFADSRNFSFKIHNTKIDVRTPDGFYESSYILPERLEMVQTMFPDYLTVQAVLAPKGSSDNERIARYYIFATPNKLDKRKISQKDFDGLRDLMREQQYTLMNQHRDKIDAAIKEGSMKISNKNNIKYELTVDEISPLGVFIDNKNAISFNTISNTDITVDGVNLSFPQACTMSLVFLKNKLVYLYGYSDYDSDRDITWIESKTNEAVSLLIRNN